MTGLASVSCSTRMDRIGARAFAPGRRTHCGSPNSGMNCHRLPRITITKKAAPLYVNMVKRRSLSLVPSAEVPQMGDPVAVILMRPPADLRLTGSPIGKHRPRWSCGERSLGVVWSRTLELCRTTSAQWQKRTDSIIGSVRNLFICQWYSERTLRVAGVCARTDLEMINQQSTPLDPGAGGARRHVPLLNSLLRSNA